ncbi:helix-turn-helix transcriptional regulator [Paenibacillus sp.]|uniref:helix-turn-helix domain-containing protein n=1 Tax=Paenibacillus sp. TaxID=58172 RepID=UPI00283126BE|nr:helix-turn-helix transcriptional regulator [Paenibacillus sp.]MDR0269523.1 helix-turn-helix domain-containing protein [Paenibacillus sp.]
MAKTQLEDMGERLKIARIKRKLTKMEVYRSTQIQPDMLESYESTQSEPNLLSLTKLSDTYKVSLDWLITGFKYNSNSRLFAAEQEVKRLRGIIEEQSRMIAAIQAIVNQGGGNGFSVKRKREEGPNKIAK